MSVIVLGLALLLDSITVRATPAQHTVFRVLAIVLIGLTTIMLVSAWQRMSLYESEYGFTHLRLYTPLFMLWMGVLFVFFLLSLFRVREHIFSLGILVFLIGYLVTLNGVNPDYTIARLNVERYRAGHELDFVYLNTLSADMIPALVPLYQETAERDPQAHDCAAQVLSGHLQTLGQPARGSGRNRVLGQSVAERRVGAARSAPGSVTCLRFGDAVQRGLWLVRLQPRLVRLSLPRSPEGDPAR